MRKYMITGLTLALAMVTPPAFAQAGGWSKNPADVPSGTYVLDPAHGKITWSLSHLGFSTYVGQFTDVNATLKLDARNPAASTLEATVRTDSVGTLNAALDHHLKSADFFDVANHPVATFRATQIRLIDSDTAEISGDLTLRGVTRPIVMTADFNQGGVNPIDKKYTIGFDGHAKIKRSEYGINYGLPVVGDDVTLHFEAEFKAQSEAVAPAAKGKK